MATVSQFLSLAFAIYLCECCYIAKYYKNRNMYVPKDVKEDVVHMLQLVASYIIGSTSHKCDICLNTTAATIKCYSVLTEFRQGSRDHFRYIIAANIQFYKITI